jgi:hypothetical protein
VNASQIVAVCVVVFFVAFLLGYAAHAFDCRWRQLLEAERELRRHG